LDILTSIINENEEMKELFISNRQKGMLWIPGPGGINLEKGIGSCTGDLLEKISVLGPLFSVSFLPNSISFKRDERFKKTSNKIDSELKNIKKQSEFEKQCSNLQEYHRKYIISLNNFVKTLLKGKVGREPIMRFLAACVVSNTARAKLGHNLA
jgi:Ubiquitin elongating factor core